MRYENQAMTVLIWVGSEEDTEVNTMLLKSLPGDRTVLHKVGSLFVRTRWLSFELAGARYVINRRNSSLVLTENINEFKSFLLVETDGIIGRVSCNAL